MLMQKRLDRMTWKEVGDLARYPFVDVLLHLVGLSRVRPTITYNRHCSLNFTSPVTKDIYPSSMIYTQARLSAENQRKYESYWTIGELLDTLLFVWRPNYLI